MTDAHQCSAGGDGPSSPGIEAMRHTPTPSLSAREKIARLIDPAAFSGLERERAWAAKWNKPDHFWLPWQSCCENALTQADAILALVPDMGEIERLTARVAELEGALQFYATQINYDRGDSYDTRGFTRPIMQDTGKIARAALSTAGGK